MSAEEVLDRARFGDGAATAPASGVATPRVRAERPGRVLMDHIRRQPLLWIGMAALAIPTMISVAKLNWATEQGAHGPIVLATGFWLIGREWKEARARQQPGSMLLTWALLIPLLALFVLARVTNIIEVEGFVMYAALVVGVYSVVGIRTLKLLWFPLVYFLFLFPPPDTLFAMITQPLKIGVSEAVVSFLYMLGYPIAASGVTIQIGQYQMLVAAACAGLTSLISLSAVGLFYTYLRYNSNWRYMIFLALTIIPVAIFANFVRVLILVLVTYHMGEAAGQGFIHGAAGMTLFVCALLSIFVIDWLASPLRDRLARMGRKTA